MENTPVLHTPRLTLDRFTQADAETVCRDLFSSEAVCRNLLLQPGTPLEEVRDILRRLEEGYAVHEDFFQWAIREQGVCIGRMSLTVNRRHLGGTVAYYLAERAWGKGYMTEALRQHHVDRLKQHKCSAKNGMIYLDILTNLERIGDHAENIATSVDKASNHLLA